MKKFVHMLQTIHSHNFYRIIQEMKEQKVPCAIFLPCSENELHNAELLSNYSSLISRLVLSYALNLTEIIFPDEFTLSEIKIDGLKNNIQMIHLSDVQDGHDKGRTVFLPFTGEKHTGFCKYFEDNGLTAIVMMTGQDSNYIRDLYCEVYSFELDRKNYEHACHIAHESGFVLENMGLGEREEEVSYVVNNAGSWIDARGNASSKAIDIDTYVKRNQLPQVDFIKFDIEGAELAALRGAKKTIYQYKPKLAISIYHKPEDMYTLIRYIKSIRPDYEIAFRHHKCDFSSNMRETAKRYRLGNSFPACWEKVFYAR